MPYDHESSEESDQETAAAALENGGGGMAQARLNGRSGAGHAVYGPAPRPTNGEAGAPHHNGQTNGVAKPGHNGHRNGHPKVNGNGDAPHTVALACFDGGCLGQGLLGYGSYCGGVVVA